MDDACVAPNHLTVEQLQDGKILARDLDTLNGTRAVGSKTRQKEINLDDDAIIQTGETFLRVKTAATLVAPERILKPEDYGWRLAAAPFALIILWFNFFIWLDAAAPLKLSNFLLVIMPVIFVMLWAGFWSVLSRLFSGTAYFCRHFRMGCFFVLGIYALYKIDIFGSYAFATDFINSYLGNFLSVTFIGLVLFKSLCLVGGTRKTGKAIVVSGLGVVVLALTYLMPVLEPKITTVADFATFLAPPALRLVSPQPKKGFMEKIAGLKNKLDASRHEEPPKDDKPSIVR